MMAVKTWFKQSVMLPLAPANDLVALRSFALTLSFAFPIVFMGVLPWVFNTAILLWPMYLALIFGILHIFFPKHLYYPYVAWMVIASILGFINTRIVLAIAYYFLIVPTGLIMQALKGLQYQHKIKTESAWVKRNEAPSKQNLKEPF